MGRICTACKKIIDKQNYRKNRTACKTCYNKKERKNYNSIFLYQHFNSSGNGKGNSQQQPKSESNKNNNSQSFSIGFSNCWKTYLMNFVFFFKKNDQFI